MGTAQGPTLDYSVTVFLTSASYQAQVGSDTGSKCMQTPKQPP